METTANIVEDIHTDLPIDNSDSESDSEEKDIFFNDVNFNLEKKYDCYSKYHYYCLNKSLSNTIAINNFLNKSCVKYFMYISLLYHIFLYLYLGISKDGGAFYTGLMYSIMYSGALMAYWIIYRQNKRLLSWSNILSHELVTDVRERFDDRLSIDTLRSIKLNKEDIFLKLTRGKGQYTHAALNQFEFMEGNITYLLFNNKAIYSFYHYCRTWELNAKIIYFVWNGFALFVLISKILPDDIISVNKGFDHEPMGLWGYYNITGQFIASLGIVHASIIVLTGFYQLRCMILNYASRIRDWRHRDLIIIRDAEAILHARNGEEDEVNDELVKREQQIIYKNFKQTRKEYLYLQKCCMTLSDIWSTPVVAIIFFCTEVVITNIFVINYQLTKCRTLGLTELDKPRDYCDFFIGYSFVWMFSALMVVGVLLHNISAINSSADKIKNAFIFSDGGLTDLPGDNQLVKPEYHAIGGRNNWIKYLESNPIRFTICGITMTSKYVVNTGYMVVSTLGTFLFSYIFTDDS